MTALLEGIGFGFLIPIIEIAQSGQSPSRAEGAPGLFVRAYQFVGVPMTLETITLGVVGVMSARYTASFVVSWLRENCGGVTPTTSGSAASTRPSTHASTTSTDTAPTRY